MRLQTYHDIPSWFEGMTLKKHEILDKEEVHHKGALHHSVHLLIIDSKGNTYARKRSASDFRYANLLTSTLGTHVEFGKTYEETLRSAVPSGVPLAWIGEFRVKDNYENEICGLFVSNIDSIPTHFNNNHRFVSPEQLKEAIESKGTTPHLAEAYRRYIMHERRI